jgi:hypothetical protein
MASRDIIDVEMLASKFKTMPKPKNPIEAKAYLNRALTLQSKIDRLWNRSPAGSDDAEYGEMLAEEFEPAFRLAEDLAEKFLGRTASILRSRRKASMRGIEARTILEMKMKDGSVIPAGSVVRVSFREDKPEIAMVEFMYSAYKIKTINLFKYIGRPFTKVPGSAALERMVDDGVAKTVTGKRAEPDGFGDDDSPSWLLVLGYI